MKRDMVISSSVMSHHFHHLSLHAAGNMWLLSVACLSFPLVQQLLPVLCYVALCCQQQGLDTLLGIQTAHDGSPEACPGIGSSAAQP